MDLSIVKDKFRHLTTKRLGGARVLMYHGIVDKMTEPILERNFHLADEIEHHVKYLHRKYNIVSADEFYELHHAGKNLDNVILITFDDGYRNNLLAAEILEKYKCPYIIFAATQHIGNPQRTIWTVELSIYIMKAPIPRIRLFDQEFDLSSAAAKNHSFTQIRRKLKTLDAVHKNKYLQQVDEQFPANFMADMLYKLPQFQLCDWDELKAISNRGGYIGSHGVAHELHNEFEQESVIAKEISDSTDEIEKHIGIRPEYFAYPNGNNTQLSYKHLALNGYKNAFTTELGTVFPSDAPLLLKRVTPTRKLNKFSYQMHKIFTEY